MYLPAAPDVRSPSFFICLQSNHLNAQDVGFFHLLTTFGGEDLEVVQGEQAAEADAFGRAAGHPSHILHELQHPVLHLAAHINNMSIIEQEQIQMNMSPSTHAHSYTLMQACKQHSG